MLLRLREQQLKWLTQKQGPWRLPAARAAKSERNAGAAHLSGVGLAPRGRAAAVGQSRRAHACAFARGGEQPEGLVSRALRAKGPISRRRPRRTRREASEIGEGALEYAQTTGQPAGRTLALGVHATHLGRLLVC